MVLYGRPKTHPYEQMYHMAKTRCVHFFDSVVSYNDQIALEVIRALEDAGLKVRKMCQ